MALAPPVSQAPRAGGAPRCAFATASATALGITSEDVARSQSEADQLEEQLRELEVESSAVGMQADHEAAKGWGYEEKKKKLQSLAAMKPPNRT